ncbi:MAG TPA: protein kinase [Bryobacteraceae bacterium]
MSTVRERPRFFWFAIAAGCWMLVVYGASIWSALTMDRIAGRAPMSLVYRQGAWIVTGVYPGGPADGVLRRGDRIVSIDGDPRGARIGPALLVHFHQPGSQFEFGFLRNGVEGHGAVPITAFPASVSYGFAASFFLVSFSFFVMAMLMGLVRPEDPLTRLGCVAGLWTAWRMFAFAMAPFEIGATGFTRDLGLLQPALELMVLPLGYHFFRRLAAVRGERFWIAPQIFFYAFCGAGALLDLAAGLFLLQGRERAVALLYEYPVHLWRAMLIQPLRPYLIAPLAMCAVILRGYAVNRDPDHKRRLRWVVVGTVAGLAPQVVMNLAGIFRLPYPLTTAQSNAFITLIPVTLAYAVVKHQVLGVQVVIRQGVKYLLARNVLAALLILPVAGLVLPFALHPERSISETFRRNPMYLNLALAIAAAASLKHRRQVQNWVDRRFFRAAYDQEQILRNLIERVAATPSLAEISRIVSDQVDAALHPRCIHVYYRENPSSGLTLGYSSSGVALPMPGDSQLCSLLLSARTPIEYPSAVIEGDRARLDELGARLIVPIIGRRPELAGMLVLGEKKSEEPYSPADKSLLQALAGQMALVCENVWLQERVEEEGRIRRDVLARLDEAQVNLVRECPRCGACYDRDVAVCSTDGAELTVTLPVERVIERRYRLESRIGRGGMGAVYQATDLRLNRAVAVKLMIGSLFGNPAALRRFEREARATARLVHPNIVAIHDYGTVGSDGAYLVMERVPGVTWRRELEKRGALSPETAARWFDQLLAGLEAAHSAGIVHRDLKPDNVLVDGDRIKILDFGLAKMTRQDEADTNSVTVPGTVMGTLGYMAPEQLAGRGADQRSDLFAAGVMAVEAVTGRPLFRGSYAEVLAAMLREDLELSAEGPAAARLQVVLRRSLAADPERRFQSAGDMRRELGPALAACPPLVSSRLADSGETDTRSMGA